MNFAEKKAYDQLKKLYDYIQCPPPQRRWGYPALCKGVPVKVRDYFNCWDFMCLDEHRGAFIQVSEVPIYSRGKAYKKKLEDFPKPYGWRKEYWWYNKQKRMFRVWEL